MAFVKVIKNKAYHKRYQVKYRRRREGKTDYQARRALVIQDKNKFASPKYRFVVRITNKDVICQVIFTKITGDVCMTAAYAHELKNYGCGVGLTNYAACYATGLLAARRVLTKLNLADTYEGCTEPDGEDFHVEQEEDAPRPFVCLLDVGLVRTTTGARVFAAMKGACDGGLDIPHNEKRFAGYEAETKSLDAEVLRKYIYGGHVGEYMALLEEDDEDEYKRQFASYLDAGIDSENIEETWEGVHAKIREDPVKKPNTKQVEKPKRHRPAKLTYDEKKAAVLAKIEKFKNQSGGKAAAAADSDDE